MTKWLADAVVLRKDKLAISIQYMRTSEAGQISLDGDLGGGGLPQEAGQERVTFIGQEARK